MRNNIILVKTNAFVCANLYYIFVMNGTKTV